MYPLNAKPKFMKFEFFIAKRLQLYTNDKATKSSAFTLNVAVTSIVIAIVIMIASISIVSGFKHTIVNKISELNAHIRISNGQNGSSAGENAPILYNDFFQSLANDSNGIVKSVQLVAEAPCIIKTPTEFNGLVFKGFQQEADTHFIESYKTKGDFDLSSNNIAISQYIADKLQIGVNDKVSVYFISNGNMKIRKLTVSAIFNTDFEDFDKNIVIGNISIPQSINRWEPNMGSAIEYTCHSLDDIDNAAQYITTRIYDYIYKNNSTEVYQLSTAKDNNSTYFAWLQLLDTNIVVILILMTVVACFSLIAGLIIVVLNRINMIGILKALGANNKSIRLIFISLAQKLILKSMIWGNIIGFSLILIQKYFHLIKLDAATYYMSYVPVEINIWLAVLNIGIFIIAAASLIAPSYIVASIKPVKSIRFE